MLRILVAAVALTVSHLASADPVTPAQVSAAQGQMLARISSAVEKYANHSRLDPAYVSYCRGELDLKTSTYPGNGLIPFGVNYNEIYDSETLDTVIAAREAYERSFMFLCLASAKNTLRKAEQDK
jgi:hypothetical protein